VVYSIFAPLASNQRDISKTDPFEFHKRTTRKTNYS
jgi:hypothetical protein